MFLMFQKWARNGTAAIYFNTLIYPDETHKRLPSATLIDQKYPQNKPNSFINICIANCADLSETN